MQGIKEATVALPDNDATRASGAAGKEVRAAPAGGGGGRALGQQGGHPVRVVVVRLEGMGGLAFAAVCPPASPL